ncbi:unnamed protein product [Trichogramma brassicae]|uniref:Uncharacterized protein n=1 Tax=Trichogramma brassicae TaxID=86971 RepID=A0A6H5HYG6_9HYME|nr:unnamed protein product [Trichogramma brassicae]
MLTNDQAARALRDMRGNGCSRRDEDAGASESAGESASENGSEDAGENVSEDENEKPKLMYQPEHATVAIYVRRYRPLLRTKARYIIRGAISEAYPETHI